MNYREKLAEAWDQYLLHFVMLELTYRCNLDCFYCYNDTAASGDVIQLQGYLSLLKDLEKMGTMHLVLTGGEPLAHPHFFEIGRAAREAGFVVRIKSNGHAMRHDMAKRVRDEIDPYSIEVSLHGMNAETHDRQTRVPGSFDQLMKNLRVMKDLGLRLQLNSTMTSWNEDEIEGMYAIADELGVILQIDSRVSPKDNGDREPLQIYSSQTGIEKLMVLQRERADKAQSEITEQKEYKSAGQQESIKRKHHCGAGTGSITIDPFGNIYPCVEWRRSVGNLHDNSIQQIWTSSTQLDDVRQTSRDVNEMINASDDVVKKVSFCPAIAEKTYGTKDVLDKMTLFKIEVIQKQD